MRDASPEAKGCCGCMMLPLFIITLPFVLVWLPLQRLAHALGIHFYFGPPGLRTCSVCHRIENPRDP